MNTQTASPQTGPVNISMMTEEDIKSLSPISPSIMRNQATINIGAIGHVSHGKSTVVECLTGVKPLRHSTEIVRNITIKLGYANFKIFKCDTCPPPECYFSIGTKEEEPETCRNMMCNGKAELVRHFSFVDCPGHDCLMATMLSGTTVMDGALLVIASNQSVPQPQTAEHLVAAEIMNLKNRMITLQTKIDLLETPNHAKHNYRQIKEFIKGTIAESSPIIPISCSLRVQSSKPQKEERKDAQDPSIDHDYPEPVRKGANIDVLLQYLVEKFPIPIRDLTSKPFMHVLRSFDVNNPGTDALQLKGGVAGGSLVRGILKKGAAIEIRPGLIIGNPDGSVTCTPIMSKVVSLFSEDVPLEAAFPGGLIGVGTLCDPALFRADALVGHVIGEPGTLPEVYTEIEADYNLLQRIVGLKEETEENASPITDKISKISKAEILMVTIGTVSCTANVVAVKRVEWKENGKKLKRNLVKLKLSKPICLEIGENIAFSRKLSGSYRLIGCGTITAGKPLQLVHDLP